MARRPIAARHFYAMEQITEEAVVRAQRRCRRSGAGASGSGCSRTKETTINPEIDGFAWSTRPEAGEADFF